MKTVERWGNGRLVRMVPSLMINSSISWLGGRSQLMRRVVRLLRARLKQLVYGNANVLCDLAEKCRSDIVSDMEWNGRAAAVFMTVLLVGSPLAD